MKDFESIKNSGPFRALLGKLERKTPFSVSGLVAAAKPFFLYLLLSGSRELPLLYVVSDSFKAEKTVSDLYALLGDEVPVEILSAGEDDSFAPEVIGVMEKLSRREKMIVVADVVSAAMKIEDPASLKKNSLTLKKGDAMPVGGLAQLLDEKGFSFTYMVEKRGDFSRRGDVFDIYPLTGDPVRLEFFGDEVEKIKKLDIDTQCSSGSLEEVKIFSMGNRQLSTIFDYFGNRDLIVLDEPSQLKLSAMEREPQVFWEEIAALLAEKFTVSISSWGHEQEVHFETEPAIPFGRNMNAFRDFVGDGVAAGREIFIITNQTVRLRELLRENDLVLPDGAFLHDSYSEGFFWHPALTVITDHELFGSSMHPKARKDKKNKVPLKLEDLEPGDHIVHNTHGIGLYHGLETKTVDGLAKEFLHIEYARGDKLYLPVDQIYLIRKFAQLEESRPQLSRMGGKEWQNTKAKVKEEVEKIAKHLLELYAQRELAPGFAFSADTVWQKEMEDSFPFAETEDQLSAITLSKADMERGRPMERLVCGDAGYGKTEVALRCAFKAAMDGKQTAVLAPTTLLAEQHFLTFSERLAPFPVKVDLLSRFRSSAEQKASLEKLSAGEVDIIIGTHRLLSKDVNFRDLGLVVVDEEQHFGVIHKERLRELTSGVDTLMLSATPIPRTLYLTLSGVRDLSRISTPPQNRLPVKTYIFPYNNDIVKGAVTRERDRGGQVFFLHNRVRGMETVALNLQKLIPGIRVATAHGQMDEEKLEMIIRDFVDGEYDVLVSTTIIQSGIDMPNVNTIIINNAYDFGLAQLYQIRGRVGRSHRQAYAYLLYPPHRVLTDNARRRMEILRDFTELGSGFHVAMKDLELRGAGSILGKEQHGFLKTVGFELYCKLLEEAVEELRGTKKPQPLGAPVMELPLSAYLPENYVSDARQKLTLYRKISDIGDEEQLKRVKEEIRDRFGPLPAEVYNLFDIARLKILLMDLMIPKISHTKEDIFMLMPFFKGFSQNMLKKLRKHRIPFEHSNNRLTFYGILKDEYWMEMLLEFMEHLREIERAREKEES